MKETFSLSLQFEAYIGSKFKGQKHYNPIPIAQQLISSRPLNQMDTSDTTPKTSSVLSHTTFEVVDYMAENEVTDSIPNLPPLGFDMNRNAEEIIEKLKTNNLNEYEYLWRYAEEIKSNNPGSTVEIMVTRGEKKRELIFQRLYICFDACKKGWLAGCRPIFGVDGCFLKTGEFLTAVGIDGNNQMYPIAWAVVEFESTDSWQWFFDLLLKDIGFSDGIGLTIISDMQKGLVEAVGLVFPEAEHRLCARHWYNNWSTKYKGDALRNQFWDCANSTYPEKLEVNIQNLDTIMAGAAKRAISIPVKKWTKAFMNAMPKCDIIENNMCESFISAIMSLSAIEESIVTLLELIRVMIMKRMAFGKQFIKKWHQDISPNAKRLLELQESECHEWRTLFNGGYGYEISFGECGFKNRQAIDIRNGCSCRLWNISGIPCTHVLCAIYYSNLNLEDYISHWYKKDTYVKAYQFSIQKLRGIESWVIDNQYKILPPNVGRPPLGRPKIVRREVKEEPKLSGKMSRKGTIISCSLCGKKGHNKKGCIPGIVFAPTTELDDANTSR